MEQNIRFTIIGRRKELPDEVLARDRREHPRQPGQHRHGAVPGDQLRRPDRNWSTRSAAWPSRCGTASSIPTSIDETTISDALYTAGHADPDLLIRTAGEMRVSNFLLWQISYAELWVTESAGPTSTGDAAPGPARLRRARRRRFGGLNGT